MSRRAMRLVLAAAAALLASGCALQAGQYAPSPENAERLRAAGPARVAVGEVRAEPGLPTATRISVRLNAMASPHGETYADYLREALRRELALARWLDAGAPVQISATLTANDLQTAGFATNDGEIEARFVVARDGVVHYDRRHRATLQWESSFAGAVALPLAQQNYPRLVAALLGQLFSDPAFAAACR